MSLETDLSRHFSAEDQSCGHQAQLALHLAGELDPAGAAAFQTHLVGCKECQADLHELERSKAAWEAAPVPAVLRFPSRLRLFLPVAGALAAALIAFFFYAQSPENPLRPKGSWTLEVAAQRQGKQFLAPSGTLLHSGDSLGFFYSSPRDGYLMLLYADAHDAPVRLFPAQGRASAKVQAGERVSVPDGAVLSPGTGCEWIIGFFTRRPLATDEAASIAQRMVSTRQGCTLGTAGAQIEAQVVTVNR
jgi:hypothetical protein